MTAAQVSVATSRARIAGRWVLAGLMVLAIALIALVVGRQQAFSPYDEYVYFDYLTKVPTQGFVRAGEEVGDIARAELECRGVTSYEPYGDGCLVGDTADDELYPYVGLTGADIYTPVYFGITWALAQPLTWLGMGLLDAGRMVGGLWLAATAGLTFLALRRLGAGLASSAGLVLLGMAAPVTLASFAFLSTDAIAITAGAALAWLTARIVTGGASAWWLVPVGVLGVLGKVQAVGALGAAALILAVHALFVRGGWRDRTAWLGTILPAAAASVLAIGAQLGWTALRSRSAVGEGADLGVGSRELPLDALVLQFAHVISSVGATQAVEAHVAFTLAVTALTLLCGAGLIAGIVGLPQSAPAQRDTAGIARSWGIGTLSLALVMIPVLTAMTFVLEGIYFEAPLRYGATLLPFLLVSAGLLLARSTWIGVGVAALSGTVLLVAWF